MRPHCAAWCAAVSRGIACIHIRARINQHPHAIAAHAAAAGSEHEGRPATVVARVHVRARVQQHAHAVGASLRTCSGVLANPSVAATAAATAAAGNAASMARRACAQPCLQPRAALCCHHVVPPARHVHARLDEGSGHAVVPGAHGSHHTVRSHHSARIRTRGHQQPHHVAVAAIVRRPQRCGAGVRPAGCRCIHVDAAGCGQQRRHGRRIARGRSGHQALHCRGFCGGRVSAAALLELLRRTATVAARTARVSSALRPLIAALRTARCCPSAGPVCVCAVLLVQCPASGHCAVRRACCVYAADALRFRIQARPVPMGRPRRTEACCALQPAWAVLAHTAERISGLHPRTHGQHTHSG